ncbi:HK97 family phage prohead protease [Clostridium felsineum]|uniref:HK97 family phage prohead protease n=1 Tax=Clostridium felsineum TaxID=36839 RepID=UPI00214D428A|nr:HK97 family phage prohead protease [Clostridium felsineum]MCR3759158.1 HK97 family phage prohead protease [Clostridium felsineum]
MKTKSINWKIKVLDQANRIIEMIGSTEDTDRAGDSMKMSGVQLGNYLKNPVILANHCYGYEEKPTVIGKALDVRIDGTQLIFKIQFAETDNGKDWFYLYSNGFMNASSIGFNPIKYEPNDNGGYDYTEWELLELSLVAVPCNPNAVQRAFTEGKISKNFMGGVTGELRQYLELGDKGGKDVKIKAIKDMVDKAVQPYKDKISSLEIEKAALVAQLKTGATLSNASKDKLKNIHDTMEKCTKELQDCHKNLKDFIGSDETDGADGQDGNKPEDKSLEIDLSDFSIKDFKGDELDIDEETIKKLIHDTVSKEFKNQK